MRFDLVLGNPYKEKYRWQELCESVFALFSPCIKAYNSQKKKPNGNFELRVRSTMDKPKLQPSDLLIYVVKTTNHGVLSAKFADVPGIENYEAAGKAVPPQGKQKLVAAEVYMEIPTNPDAPWHMWEMVRLSPTQLAKMIFHEALHLKTGFSDASLHNKGGLAHAYPLDKELTTHGANSNVALMAAHIHKHLNVWTEGWAWMGVAAEPV
jgi:hypothetical protein